MRLFGKKCPCCGRRTGVETMRHHDGTETWVCGWCKSSGLVRQGKLGPSATFDDFRR